MNEQKLVRNFDNIILLIENGNDDGFLNLVLLNTKTDYVVGTLSLVIYQDKEGKNVEGKITSVGSERGYGKYLYEFALMYIDVPILPSRDGDVTGEAMKVWEKLYNDPKVIKEELNWEDDDYTLSILFGDQVYYTLKEKEEIYQNYLENGEDLKNDIELQIFNTKYTIKNNSNLYLRLKKIGEKFMKNNNTDEYFDVDYSYFF